MALLKQRRVLAFKSETTAGTAETLTSAEAIFVFDPVIQADIPMAERLATGSLSRLASVPGARKGKVTFNVELAGAGIAGDPAWAGLLLGCGLKVTTSVYTPTSATTDYHTLTIGVYESGMFKVLSGCMGTFSLEGEYGKPASIKFEFEGIWNAPTDASMLTLPTYTVIPPRVASATFTIGAHTPLISKLSLDWGAKISMAEDITKVSGYSRAVVTGRDVKGKIDPECELVAAWDVFGSWIAGTTAALSLAIGSATHNTITIAAGHVQYQNVQEADRDGLVTSDIDWVACATSAGDDELSITFS